MLTNLGETKSGKIIFYDDESKEFVIVDPRMTVADRVKDRRSIE
jgi:hypothetical protein